MRLQKRPNTPSSQRRGLDYQAQKTRARPPGNVCVSESIASSRIFAVYIEVNSSRGLAQLAKAGKRDEVSRRSIAKKKGRKKEKKKERKTRGS